MPSETNPVKADARTIREMLDKIKYSIDVFQREYRWERKHIEQLLVDFESKFLADYDEVHERKDVANYSRYYLGSVVICIKDNKHWIIDGQQRLTSITLLLIYLHNLQKPKEQVSVKDLIFSESYGQKSYNLDIEDRIACMDSLYHNKEFNSKNEDESVQNIIQRYEDIEEIFPKELTGKSLPYFIDWLINNVILVEIKTYSDDDAYTVFETMNDRGLSLTSTEMLKGYLLSNLDSAEEKVKLNELWRRKIAKLRDKYGEDSEDADFFTAWLRAKYAKSIRTGKKGAENEDFEKISLKFNNWIRDNKDIIGLNNSSDFYDFINRKFNFFSDIYLQIASATLTLNHELEHVFYINKFEFPYTFYFPLIMSPIKIDDGQETIRKKISMVSRFIETFIIYRLVNYRTLSHSSIRYTMFNLVKEIRDKNTVELAKILKSKVNNFEDKLDKIMDFQLHQQNKRKVQYLLARITNHIEKKCSIQSNFTNYIDRNISKPFEIEHIWANRFEDHMNEFNDEGKFEDFRNKIGGLILIPQGFNQSYGSMSYEEKLPHYFSQNMLAKTLNPQCYEKNPSFIDYVKKSKLPFVPHRHFKKSDLMKRQLLYKKICEEIWNVNAFDDITKGNQS